MKTSFEKLVRLRELRNTLITQDFNAADRRRLLDEQDNILNSVAMPPLDLLGNSNSKAWAAAFNTAFPSVDIDTAEHWFANAILAGATDGANEGHRQGKEYAAGRLVELLKNIRTTPTVANYRVMTDHNATSTIGELITETLKAEGFGE